MPYQSWELALQCSNMMNGTCIEEEMASSNTFVYNLAIPGSMPHGDDTD